MPQTPPADVALVPVGPKFAQASVRIMPFPNSWSHTKIQQASQQHAKAFGYVVTAWSGLSSKGTPYGAVRFSKPASARQMIASCVGGPPRIPKFTKWEGKVPADVLGGLPKPAGDASGKAAC